MEVAGDTLIFYRPGEEPQEHNRRHHQPDWITFAPLLQLPSSLVQRSLPHLPSTAATAAACIEHERGEEEQKTALWHAWHVYFISSSSPAQQNNKETIRTENQLRSEYGFVGYRGGVGRLLAFLTPQSTFAAALLYSSVLLPHPSLPSSLGCCCCCCSPLLLACLLELWELKANNTSDTQTQRNKRGDRWWMGEKWLSVYETTTTTEFYSILCIKCVLYRYCCCSFGGGGGDGAWVLDFESEELLSISLASEWMVLSCV